MTNFWDPAANVESPLYRQGDLLLPILVPSIETPPNGAVDIPTGKSRATMALYFTERSPLLVLSQCCSIEKQLSGGTHISLIVCPIRTVSQRRPVEMLMAQTGNPASGQFVDRMAVAPFTDIVPAWGPLAGPAAAQVQRMSQVNFNECLSVLVPHDDAVGRPMVLARMTAHARSQLRSKLMEFFSRPTIEDLQEAGVPP